MKIESVMKSGNYTTVTFSDELIVYGVLITEATNTIEFMKLGPNDIEATLINEQTYPKYLEELKDKYLPTLLEHLQNQ